MGVLRSLAFAPACAALLGCGTIHFDVPEGRRVRLLERDEPVSVRDERTVWFALWGAITLGENHTAPVIQEYDLAEVRLHNRYSFTDVLINSVASLIGFSRRRVVVEGNPAGRERKTE